MHEHPEERTGYGYLAAKSVDACRGGDVVQGVLAECVGYRSGTAKREEGEKGTTLLHAQA